MASLINEFRQSSIEVVLKNLHDTFSKEITVYKNAQGICVSSSPTYNSIYGDKGPINSIQYEMISKKFQARIYFVKSDQEFFYNGRGLQGSDNKLILPQGFVKILVEREAYLFIKEARKIEFDGCIYSIRSAGNHANPEGLFNNIFYEFHLTPLNE
jgi:hypothetical protein